MRILIEIVFKVFNENFNAFHRRNAIFVFNTIASKFVYPKNNCVAVQRIAIAKLKINQKHFYLWSTKENFKQFKFLIDWNLQGNCALDVKQ